MRAVIQRVLQASVRVQEAGGSRVAGEIGPGILLLLGVGREDSEATAERLLDRLLRFRIFEDDAGKMNRSLADTGGGLLVVSQFTLLADLSKGNRPSFVPAADPETANRLYEHFLARARFAHSGPVASGVFGADMKVSLVNDGPVTFVLEA